MFDATVQRHLPLRKGWPARIRSSTVQAISLANFSLTFARGVAANSIDRRMRLQAEVDRLRQEVALLPAIRKRGNLAFGAEDAIEGGGVVPRGGRRGPAAEISVVTIVRWRPSDAAQLGRSGLASGVRSRSTSGRP